jgi:maltose alpha-D-glucosyltransferase/alpha-amylase
MNPPENHPAGTGARPFDWAAEPGALAYGIDVSRFADSDGDGYGDLAGVIQRLEYVASLGTTWIWLLPFYPSLRRDNGYDVDDHTAVDARFGDVETVRRLVSRAHELGMRVLVDFVAHHTSDRHRWFRAAEEDPDSTFARYYVWSDDESREPGDEPMFPGEEDNVWAYSERAQRYYHHQFYHFQPDLNATDPDVADELIRIGHFWLDAGVDGFRVDAAVLIVAAKGRPGTDADDDSFFDAFRKGLARLREDVVLIAEADQSPERMSNLVGGHRFDAIIDFALNNALYLALARGEAQPIRDELVRLDRHIPPSARLNFVRNADELDLQQLTAEERREAFAHFGPDPAMLIYGRGIRRAWAPMMQPPDRLRMTVSLLMALPGVPLLMAGQEIGAGDDLSVEGRGASRTTMQWDDSRHGGFTTAVHSPLTLPAQEDGPFGYRSINVAAQEEEPESLLALTRALSRLKRETGATVDGWRAVQAGSPAVLALERDGVLTLHNLGADTVGVQLPDEEHGEVLLAERWDGREFGPYGFAWLARSA